MQICYVLTASPGDCRYLWMACASILALRRLHRTVKVLVFCDEPSLEVIRAARTPIMELAARLVPIPTPEGSIRERSRFVKTSLRQYVDSDFLYLDADTVPVGRIDEMFDAPNDIAGVLDFNKDPQDHWFPPGWTDLYHQLGWTHPTRYYLNSGVLLLRDTPRVREFSREWHSRWHDSCQAGVANDQPSLNSTLAAMHIPVTLLPNKFNAMVLSQPWLFRGCRIAHFFEANAFGGTLVGHLADHLRDTGRLDEHAIDTCVREGHPWAPGYAAWQMWRSRNYVRATLLKARQVLGRVNRA